MWLRAPGGLLMRWIVDTFHACQMTGIIMPTRGWVLNGLGLYKTDEGFWWLVHINSGQGVVRLGVDPENGPNHLFEILGIADEVVDATNWTFEAPDGWKNHDPALPAKLNAIAAKFPGWVESPARHHRMDDLSEKLARTRGVNEDMQEAARKAGFQL